MAIYTKSKKRAAEDSAASAGAGCTKRLRLTFSKSPSPSSSPITTPPPSPEASYKKNNSINTEANFLAFPATKTIEMPTGELIKAAETFPRHLVRDPSKHWTSSTFTLDFPALTNRCTFLLKYEWAYERKRGLNDDDSDGDESSAAAAGHLVFRPVCWPVAPADTIIKKLFIHRDRRNITWTGPWAAAKLAAEIERYERVKWFWLFNDGYMYFHGYDDKYYYASHRFSRELESQWVVAWLGELIGEGELGKIMKHHAEMKKEEAEKKVKVKVE